MYLMNTRPNICFVVNTLSQFMTDSRHVHLIAAKHILRYLKEQDKRSPNRPRLAGIRQINFGENHTFQDLNRNFNHLASFSIERANRD